MSADTLSAAERQVLILVRGIELRARDWQTGEPIDPTAETVDRHAPLLLGHRIVGHAGAVDDLVQLGLLRRVGTRYRLTAEGRRRASALFKAFSAAAYGRRLTRLGRSAAYAKLCRRVQGHALVSFGLLDAEQLDAIVAAVALDAGQAGLEIGCGAGRVSEHISDISGALVTGTDLAAAAVRQASGRTRHKRDRLRFLPADFDTLDLAPRTFDAVFAIDALYLAENVARTVGRLRTLLRPGGRIVLLGSELLAPGAPRHGGVWRHDTRVALALRRWRLPYRVVEYTANEHRFWQRQRRAATALRRAFVAEGNGALCDELLREAERSLAWCDAGRVRRALYQARLPAAAATRG